jgi:hypothetical protein
MAGYTIEIPEHMLKELKIFAVRNHIDLPQATARAFALIQIANTAANNTDQLAVIHVEPGQQPKIVSRIDGV